MFSLNYILEQLFEMLQMLKFSDQYLFGIFDVMFQLKQLLLKIIVILMLFIGLLLLFYFLVFFFQFEYFMQRNGILVLLCFSMVKLGFRESLFLLRYLWKSFDVEQGWWLKVVFLFEFIGQEQVQLVGVKMLILMLWSFLVLLRFLKLVQVFVQQ